MAETFVTWEGEKNNFIFDEEKKKYVCEESKVVVWSNKVVLPHTF